MGLFDQAVETVEGWLGMDKKEDAPAAAPAAAKKDPSQDIEVQRRMQDVQAAQQNLDRSNKELASAKQALEQGQQELQKASKARSDAEGDGGAGVPGSSASKAAGQAAKAEEAVKQKVAGLQRHVDTMTKEVQEREGDLRQMKYRLEQAKNKAGGGGAAGPGQAGA